MTTAEMVAQLVSVGTPADVAAAIVDQAFAAGVASKDSPRTVLGQQTDDRGDAPDMVLARRRERDRQRKRTERAAKASKDASADKSGGAVVLLASSSLTSSEGSEERKKETEVNVSARARSNDRAKRGSRLPSDWTPTGEYFSAATELGLEADQIVAVGAEFHDYWVGVPGQRGCKLDWLATWRNRCREVVARNKRFNGGHRGKRTDGIHRSGGDAFLAGLAEVAQDIRGNRQMAGPTDPDLPFGEPIAARRRTAAG